MPVIFRAFSLRHAAPEVIAEPLDASPAGDVWSLGATLLCMLTCHELAADKDVRSALRSAFEPLWTLERHAERKLQLLGKVRAGVKAVPIPIPHAGLSDEEQKRWKAAPKGLRKFIARCLVVDPDLRPTALDLRLDPYIVEVEALLSPSEATPPL